MTRLIYQGMLIGMLISIAADGGHWFITTPSHDASATRRLLVAIQIVVMLAAAFWVWRRARKDAETLELKLLTRRGE